MKLMKRRFFLSAFSLFFTGLTSTLSAQTPATLAKPTPTERVNLWPGKAPVGEGNFKALFDAIEEDQISRGVLRDED